MKKVAVITGASRGIGAATALLLAQKGYSVCVNYRNAEDKAQKIVSSILKQNGNAIAVQADIASENDILNLFKTVDAQLGPVTVLINNAGINGGVCAVEDISSEKLHAVFTTNVFGAFLSSREAIQRMKKNGGGCIINVSSEAAKFGGTQMAHYSASKAALNTFTLALAREGAPHNIRVNAVSPGVIDTELHQHSSSERVSQLILSLPMKRMGTTEEVASTIAWLVSEEASYVSGALIPITGAR